MATVKPAAITRRPKSATLGVILGISCTTTTPGPVPPRYTGRVTPSCVNAVSGKPSSAAPIPRTPEAGELAAQRAATHAAEVERVTVELLQVERRAVPRLRVGARLEPHLLADL